MKMSIDKFNERVGKFVWEVLIPDTDEFADKCAFGGIARSGLLKIDDRKMEPLAVLGMIDEEKNVVVEQLKNVLYGAAEAGGGVIYVKKGFFTVKIPRTMVDKFLAYLETGTVQ